MTQIVPANKTVSALCGEQKKKENRPYRFSDHCVRTECEEGILLYHTLTGELLLLRDEDELRRQEEALVSGWFYVPEEFDEKRFTDDIRRVCGMMRPHSGAKTSYTILTTTDCNARCYYCYEKGIRREPMTDETAAATAERIARDSRGEKVRLRWFGGEPLYNRRAIDLICGALEQKAIDFESTMVSNGYYLGRETVRDAVTRWHLKRVQITVDGTEQKYNRIKAYIDKDENPYQRVMNNIREALDAGIHVNIRLNMDAGNAADLLKLTGELAERFAGYEELDVYVAVLHEFAGKIVAHETREQRDRAYFAIRESLKQNGLLRQRELPSALREYCCIADNDASETVLPDGRIGRCEHYSESMITGHIRSEKQDEAVTERWKARLSVPECSRCALYPQCRKLALCEWNKDGCDGLERRIEIIEIKEQMQNKYRERKKEETEIAAD